MTDLDGRYIVGQQWRRWVVLDQSWNPPERVGKPHPDQTSARAAADRLNTPAPTPQRTRQTSLFDQEVSHP